MALSILLTFSASTVSAAENVNNTETKDYYAIFGISEGDSSNVSNDKLKELLNENQSLFNESPTSNSLDMTTTAYTLEQSGINIALGFSFKGAVWVTRDGATLNYEHGHAAMIYTVADWDKSSLEHRGSGSMNPIDWANSYSRIYNLEGDAYWAARETLKVYNVSDTDNGSINYESMWCATDYCAANLMGLPYAPLALKTVTAVNCATLVYKAYALQNYGGTPIYLGSPSSATVIPKDLVEDNKLILQMSFQWPGAHTWDLTELNVSSRGGAFVIESIEQ